MIPIKTKLAVAAEIFADSEALALIAEVTKSWLEGCKVTR